MYDMYVKDFRFRITMQMLFAAATE